MKKVLKNLHRQTLRTLLIQNLEYKNLFKKSSSFTLEPLLECKIVQKNILSAVFEMYERQINKWMKRQVVWLQVAWLHGCTL